MLRTLWSKVRVRTLRYGNLDCKIKQAAILSLGDPINLPTASSACAVRSAWRQAKHALGSTCVW